MARIMKTTEQDLRRCRPRRQQCRRSRTAPAISAITKNTNSILKRRLEFLVRTAARSKWRAHHHRTVPAQR